MKKQKKIAIIVILLSILLMTPKVLANSNSNDDIIKRVEYSEDFKRWLKLSDEEKNKTIQPRMYDVIVTDFNTRTIFYKMRLLRARSNSKYNLKNIIPENLLTKDQQETNSCWAFAALTSLETNLALSDYRQDIKAKTYDFSERHIEYATSKLFENNETNESGYNRTVGEGGQWYTAESYLTNGSGAVPETEMPFENNENLIEINQIKNKTVSSQVYDTIDFPDYNAQDDAEKSKIMNKIKKHIQENGSVFASIHGNSALGDENCYKEETEAKYCNNTTSHVADHAISIVGWDDNYSVENFSENARPSNNGAWIVKNSWGNIREYMYVSYEDCNISKILCGIEKATNKVEYENIYQYDEYFPATYVEFNNSKIMLCNVFDKKTDANEYLTQVALYAPETYTCKVYVNPNGTEKTKKDMQLIELKTGETETVEAGYHTLEFAEPLKINANSFAVIIEVQGTRNKINFELESKVDGVSAFDSVKVENGKCFLAAGNDMDNCKWYDLGKLSQVNSKLPDGDGTIKAFTITKEEEEVPDKKPDNQENEETIENSNLDDIKCNINNVKYYTFTDKNNHEYLVLNLTVDGITQKSQANSLEYYYYISANKDEKNIENWVKIEGKQIEENKLQFEINTQNIKNLDEISNAESLYLYIKEVSSKDGKKSEVTSRAMQLDSKTKAEIYLDNIKVEELQIDDNDMVIDNTVSPNELPKAGIQKIVISIIVISVLSVIVLIRYKKISEDIK
ncbi:cell surface protein (Probable cell surface-associated cysteine protease) [Clostridium sp. CAG:356]|nr:cell surface protein (Probable cell surface-associated cysteine protease) [Clostridium sp. CAG:356]